jgi:hemoglobin
MTECQDFADLADRADVEALLRRFYGQVLGDDILAEPFAEVRDVSGMDASMTAPRCLPTTSFGG